MTIKYFNEEDGNYYDITGATGSSLIIGANGFEVKSNPKIYRIDITQVSTGDPTIDYEYENTIGNIIWTYVSSGVYNGELTGAFSGEIPEQTRAFYNLSISSCSNTYTIKKIDSNNIELKVRDKNCVLSDDVLKTTFLEFIIY